MKDRLGRIRVVIRHPINNDGFPFGFPSTSLKRAPTHIHTHTSSKHWLGPGPFEPERVQRAVVSLARASQILAGPDKSRLLALRCQIISWSSTLRSRFRLYRGGGPDSGPNVGPASQKLVERLMFKLKCYVLRNLFSNTRASSKHRDKASVFFLVVDSSRGTCNFRGFSCSIRMDRVDLCPKPKAGSFRNPCARLVVPLQQQRTQDQCSLAQRTQK